ncbi:glutamate 5-kinase [Synechococcus sp. PCC 7502]|uniref:glutamate 5-kinase n=1 Tax=Synechococcus sp. PCC 7502 TaxID=1173263 RepID=UPI00029FEC55|nr:glutamate 5-kinase [Synechococcus sp. PCC 7502]AFY74859.1 glutamate 5-kinase [Synechococcus sp. PCC 7502]
MQTLVIKIGTSSLTQPSSGDIHISAIAALVEVVVKLQRDGYRVVLVSSGAVGIGCARLGIKEKPSKISLKQAIAAVGQGRLMGIYDDFFGLFNQPVAQVLLTRANLIQRQHYINVYSTFQELLELGVVPIVNENDTVAVEELKFGDNDTLSALVASIIEADWLFLLTDVDRLYSANPRLDPDAIPIMTVNHQELWNLDIDTSSGNANQNSNQNGSQNSSQWGTGGMATKLSAAKIAAIAGVKTVICKGSEPQSIIKILGGENLGTQFEPQPRTVNARKRWIAYAMIPMGKLVLDEGAVKAVLTKGRSLLPAGIIDVLGNFEAQQAVSLCDRSGKEIARGLTNYTSAEIQQIQGQQSEDISRILGFEGADTIVHRDNLVLMEGNAD